jgi:hypothetical protein
MRRVLLRDFQRLILGEDEYRLIYVAMGFIFLTTLGTLVTLLLALFRGGWWLSGQLKEHELLIKKNSSDNDAAHEKIRWLTERVIGGKG